MVAELLSSPGMTLCFGSFLMYSKCNYHYAREETARAIRSKITYGGYRNNGKLLQNIKHSRWKSIVITLTVDPRTSRYVI